MNYIIGMDIDGVLANFNETFRQKVIAVTGRNLFIEDGKEIEFVNGLEPPCWNYVVEAYSYTKEENRACWDSVLQDASFWERLKPLSMAASAISYLKKLRSSGSTIYFPTTRAGVNPHRQTADWLRLSMNFTTPQVLICGLKHGKGGIAAGLHFTHFFDDKPENCYEVREACPDASVFLVNARYNTWAHSELAQKRITLIENPAQVLRLL